MIDTLRSGSSGPILRVVFRVDASHEIGTGHVMRCRTLARVFLDRGHQVEFVSNDLPAALRVRVEEVGAALSRLTPLELPTATKSNADPIDVIIFDGYHLGRELAAIVGDPPTVVVIDDGNELEVTGSDVVINPNPYAAPQMYPEAGDTRLLIGSRFALIRPGIIELHPIDPDPRGRTVGIAIGGSDIKAITPRLVEWMMTVPETKAVVAAGPASKQRDALEALALEWPGRVIIDRGDLSDTFGNADLAVVGGGSTLWEIAYLGLPAVVAMVADNQEVGSHTAQQMGLAIVVDMRSGGSIEELQERILELLDSPCLRQAMMGAAVDTFDGQGPDRVVDAIERRASEGR